MVNLQAFEGLSNPEEAYNEYLRWSCFMALGFGSLSFKLMRGEILSQYQLNALFIS